MSIEEEASSSASFEPVEFKGEQARITPLTIGFSPYAMLVVVQVENLTDTPFKCNWVKKSNPQESKIYIIDSAQSEYYYQMASNLSGDVLPENPREGIFEFPIPRHATSELEIHFSGITFTKKRSSKVSVSFSYRSEELGDRINGAIESPKIISLIDEYVDTQLSANTKAVNDHLVGGTSPLAWVVLILIVFFVLGALF